MFAFTVYRKSLRMFFDLNSVVWLEVTSDEC
jgi:hypothetical protein